MRSARARRAHWAEELEKARAAQDRAKVSEALKFVSEYDAFIAELERQTAATPRGSRDDT